MPCRCRHRRQRGNITPGNRTVVVRHDTLKARIIRAFKKAMEAENKDRQKRGSVQYYYLSIIAGLVLHV